ncbi:MAG: ketoacyl-ACP synthase III [Odoribacteraceae bacterium]|jgi:3-oxoacyl-[acyl-carrier-protein] synthase-3|nr:ketoacyl-ACP synthase III [Odoribacteraceae bacterium]
MTLEKNRDMYVNAIAHYLPAGRVPNSYFKSINGLDDEWIFSRTGIRTRSKAGDGENTNTMAVEAVRALERQLGSPLSGIDLIVTGTYSPHDTVFTASHVVQRVFRLDGARCLTVSSACSSLINALEIAGMYIAAGRISRALVIASEHNSAYARESCPQSGHLWGDGAVAMLVSTTVFGRKPALVSSVYTRGLGHAGKADTAVHLRPLLDGISMPGGRDVFINACHYMVEALERVTADRGLTINDLSFIATHQANKRIMDAIARQVGVPASSMLSDIEELGNTGCPSCGIALSRGLERVKSGDLVALTVFGGGYSCGAALLEFL